MKLAHVGLASAALIAGSYAIAQTHSSNSAPCAPCQAIIVLPSGCGGGIVVAPEPIRVQPKAPTSITWKVVSPGWTFAEKGIDIGNAPKSLKTTTSTGDTYTVSFDPGGPQAIYKYTINLKSASGPCSVDPTIMNY